MKTSCDDVQGQSGCYSAYWVQDEKDAFVEDFCVLLTKIKQHNSTVMAAAWVL